jgi:hypothetical protein
MDGGLHNDKSLTQIPGLRPDRLARLMRAAVARCDLDLTDLVVFTEAASGAYVVTPVLAALAGARRVFALARSSAYGTVEETAQATRRLAGIAMVADQIEIVTRKQPGVIGQADIITNSGHVRPIDSEMVTWMKRTAVVPLMFESWEFRPGDVDLAACTKHGIPVAGTNERNPAVDMFSSIGMMAVRLLLDAGVAVCGSRVLVLSDNPFQPVLERSLAQCGAIVESSESLETQAELTDLDVVLVAMRPRAQPVVGSREATLIAERYPGAIVAQFWGDLDRSELSCRDVSFWPIEAPLQGHQGILPSSIGPEPVIRLQAGGLKVGEVMARVRLSGSASRDPAGAAVDAAVASGFGQALTNDMGARDA